MNGYDTNYNVESVPKKRAGFVLTIILIILLLGIGYAVLQALLKISGTTTVSKNTWDVFFDLDSIDYHMSDGVSVLDQPSIEETTVSNIVLGFEKPGDYLDIYVDVRNAGTLDAMIKDVEVSVDGEDEWPARFYYDVSYFDGIPLSAKQILRAGTREILKVVIGYNPNITPQQLSDEEESYDFSFAVTYEQADSTATEIVRHYVYSFSGVDVVIGEPLPEGAGVEDNYQDIISTYGYPFFLRHTIVDNKVVGSALGFVYNQNAHFLPHNQYLYYSAARELYYTFNGTGYCDDESLNSSLYECGNIPYGNSSTFDIGMLDIFWAAGMKDANQVLHVCSVCGKKARCGLNNDFDLDSFCEVDS
ncbi:MAG: hypothetical protein IKF71_03670 [Bacilli bacterium]|nr:hypothetical protein [Bacilli bacterium]